MSKSLALDASLSNCGYSIWQDGEYLQSGQFKPTGTDWIDKIQSVARWLYGLSMKHDFCVLFYEYPSGSRNHDTSIKLGALMYAVALFARFHKTTFITVRPHEVKATGIHKNSIDNPYKCFDIPIHKDGTANKTALKRIGDEVDSIGIYLAGMEKVKDV